VRDGSTSTTDTMEDDEEKGERRGDGEGKAGEEE
jgi:hypothetical protein